MSGPLHRLRRSLREWWYRRLGLCVRCGVPITATDRACNDCPPPHGRTGNPFDGRRCDLAADIRNATNRGGH